MDENNKALVASNLTIAFYAGQEPKATYLEEERRTSAQRKEPLPDKRGVPTISPQEVFDVYLRFLAKLKSSD